MSRDIYLVGSVPMASAREVFETLSAALGARIKRLPDGETGERGDWISWLEPVFSKHPAFQKSGEFFRVHATGTGRERYTLKPGSSCKTSVSTICSMPTSPGNPMPSPNSRRMLG